MSLETNIMNEMKEAMKAKDEATLRSLRAIKAAIIIAKTEPGANGEISAEAEIKMLQKLVKQRKDSLAIFTEQNRPELAQKEAEEIAVIEKFLPKQMSEDELREAVKVIIGNVGATSAADMGKVMGVASKELTGKIDGKAISAMVKSLL